MTIYLEVPLTEEIYQQVKALAYAEQKEIEQLLSEKLAMVFAKSEPSQTDIQKEIEAFRQLHPTLQQTYLGKYVAIYQGQLIDHDADNDALFQRIEANYPDQFVLMRKVEPIVERVLHFRSPRFVS